MNPGEVYDTHSHWAQVHHEDGRYYQLIGYPASCTGSLRLDEDRHTVSCDGCQLRLALPKPSAAAAF